MRTYLLSSVLQAVLQSSFSITDSKANGTINEHVTAAGRSGYFNEFAESPFLSRHKVFFLRGE